MAKTIEEIQELINEKSLDERQLINLIADYLQANPPGGESSVPTLAQVLEAGNSTGGTNISMGNNSSIVNANSISVGPDGDTITNLTDAGIITAGFVDASSYKLNGSTGADATDADTVTVEKGIVTSAT